MQREFQTRNYQKSQTSVSSDSPIKIDYLKLHGFHGNSRKKSLSKFTPLKKSSRPIDSFRSRQKEDIDSQNNLTHEIKSEKRDDTNFPKKKKAESLKREKCIKVSSEIPRRLQLQKNQIRASCRCTFKLEEERQRLHQRQKQANKPSLFKPLDFPNISGFVRTGKLVETLM